jgi:hypothetical protein
LLEIIRHRTGNDAIAFLQSSLVGAGRDLELIPAVAPITD